MLVDKVDEFVDSVRRLPRIDGDPLFVAEEDQLGKSGDVLRDTESSRHHTVNLRDDDVGHVCGHLFPRFLNLFALAAPHCAEIDKDQGRRGEEAVKIIRAVHLNYIATLNQCEKQSQLRRDMKIGVL